MSRRAGRQHDYRRSLDLSRALCGEWEELCARYLPLTAEGAVWRYSRPPERRDPGQGWKLHISSTVLTACKVLGAVAPFLRERGVMFKAPASLRELERINCGLFYGYSQVGKFITVYPRSDREALSVARRVHRLTKDLRAPAVPFDLRFRPGGCVYYRYGAFDAAEIENPDGTRTPAVKGPGGVLVPDVREAAKPEWVTDPLAPRRPGRAPSDSPLQTTFRAFRALTQRGKGGVYQGVDLSGVRPRFCLIKEGRRDGEVQWDGRDGRWRVEHEERVLHSLRAAGVAVPGVYSSFEAGGNYYLVTEFVEGATLQTLLAARRRRLTINQVLDYGVRLARLLSGIHAAGWVWRDCKPANIVVTKGGDLRPLDFEGACLIRRPDPVPWATHPFAPPESRKGGRRARGVGDDLYALGVVIYFLLTGRLPEEGASAPVETPGRNVPARVSRLVTKLLAADPRRRPSAADVEATLMAAAASPRLSPRTNREPSRVLARGAGRAAGRPPGRDAVAVE